MKIYTCFLFCVVVLMSVDRCDKAKEQIDEQIMLGEAFEIKLEQTLKIKGEPLGLTFSKLVESRCPANTNCMRAGEAVATIDLTNTSDTQGLLLEVKAYCHEDDGSCGMKKTAKGYTVQILNIYPYPGTEDDKGKRAKLIVTKYEKPVQGNGLLK